MSDGDHDVGNVIGDLVTGAAGRSLGWDFQELMMLVEMDWRRENRRWQATNGTRGCVRRVSNDGELGLRVMGFRWGVGTPSRGVYGCSGRGHVTGVVVEVLEKR